MLRRICIICKNCGANIRPHSKYCTSCGIKINNHQNDSYNPNTTKNNKSLIIIVSAIIIMTSIVLQNIVKNDSDENIIATVKEKKITYDEILYADTNEGTTETLITLVDNYISSKEIKATNEDMDYVQEVVDYYTEYANYYETDLKTFLTEYIGINNISTEEELFDFVLEDYKKTLTVQKFIGNNASEEDLRTFYKKNYGDSLTVKHILIEIIDNETESYNKATNLIEILNSTPINELDKKFDELALNNSDDVGTYSNGGLVENFSKSDVVEEFFNASYNLEIGAYTTEPIKTSYGYHIILKISSKPAEKYEDIIEDVKKSYAENLLNQDDNLFYKTWVEIRKEYNFEIKDTDILEKYNEMISEY